MSETAPVNASSTAIEQVDANIFESRRTFPSQSDAERQTGIPRTTIRRCLRHVGDTFMVCTVVILLINLKAEKSVLGTLLFTELIIIMQCLDSV
jgi:hypothetical protein